MKTYNYLNLKIIKSQKLEYYRNLKQNFSKIMAMLLVTYITIKIYLSEDFKSDNIKMKHNLI